MGGTKMITYTLERELGTSLKATGWQRVGFSKGRTSGSWDTHPDSKGMKVSEVGKENKYRWEVTG
jgi:hypothetical protein